MQERRAPTQIMVLAFSDVVDSVALKRRLGDARAAQLIAQHDAITRRIIGENGEGTILKDTGDGFLMRFDTVSAAVSFALELQRAMRDHDWGAQRLEVRIGLHLGEVSQLENESGESAKLSGLAVDLTARIMGLAQGGQILMTRALFDNARQFVRDRDGAEVGRIVWMAHGQYIFKGHDEPIEIFEVGVDGAAPLHSPPDGEKAHRVLSPGEEETLGWRPAHGLEVPGRSGWILEKRIGEGGYGEVWLGIHEKTKTPRAFKFCFDVDRLRSLKRELTLFRLLHEALGDRDDIARIFEVQLDEAPFYLEGEYTEAGDLENWAQARGGIGRISIAERVRIVQQIAEATAAAHSVGILHKDIKPSNILIHQSGDKPPVPRLADFGIGMLVDRPATGERPITMAGFTEIGGNESSRTGTRLYAPPESLSGKPFTAQGDVYALGVLLYQMVVGDLQRPLATGWERTITDPLLIEDIAACVQGDPELRLQTAHELAHRLAHLDARRIARQEEINRRSALARRKRMARLAVAAIIVLTTLLSIVGIGLMRERRLRQMAEIESSKNRAVVDYIEDMFKMAKLDELGRKARIVQILEPAVEGLHRLDGQPAVRGGLEYAYGSLFLSLGLTGEAQSLLDQALQRLEKVAHDDDRTLLRTRNRLGFLHLRQGRVEEAAPLLESTYERQRTQYGADDLDTLEFMNDFAELRAAQNRTEDAIDLYRTALTAHERRIQESADNTAGHAFAESMRVRNNYAMLLTSSEMLSEAEALYTDAVDRAQQRFGLDNPITLTLINNYGLWLISNRRSGDAADLMEPHLETVRAVYGSGHADAILYTTNLAVAQIRAGRATGRDLLMETLDESDEPIPAVLFAQQEFARLLVDDEKLSEAQELYDAVLSARQELFGPADRRTLNTMNDIAWLCEEQGRFDDAETVYKQQIAILEDEYGEDDFDTLGAKNNYAYLLRSQERFAEARSMYESVVAGANRTMTEDQWQRWFFQGRLGLCLLAMNEAEAAEKELTSACTGLARLFGDGDFATQELIAALVECHTRLGNSDAADEYRARLTEP